MSTRTYVWLAGRSALLWVGVSFTAMGTVLFAVGVHDFREGLAFRQHGITTTATVVSRRIKEATGKDQPTTEYELAYTFRTAANELMAGVAVVPVEQWEATQDGAPLQIHYPADRPYESRLANDGGWGVAPGFVPLGAVFGGIGLTFLMVQLRRRRLVASLLRAGATAEGTITRVAPSSVRINRVRQMQLDYEFVDAAGQSHAGTTGALAPDVARRWKHGDRGPVRYDARDPRRSIFADAEVPRARGRRK